jgi:cytidine deaminase
MKVGLIFALSSFTINCTLMNHIEVSVKLIVQDLHEMTEIEKKLVLKAVSQLDFAYAPYSNFHVGAAVLLENDNIYGGCNQENASYPLCMCGERVALYHTAISEPNGLIKALAITARNQYHQLTAPVMPCGACRQVILEYEQKQGQKIKIYLKTDDDKVYISESAANLIPFGFDASFLK